MNARVRAPSTTRSASRSAVSACTERRTGAPRSPTEVGERQSHRTNDVDTSRQPSWVTATTGGRRAARADTSGSETVAEARTKTGSAPYRAATRRSRRSTGCHVRAEDPAIGVALVDDDELQRPQER